MDANQFPVDPGPPPTQCPSPYCSEGMGFDLLTVIEFTDDEAINSPAAETHISWKCRNCGCQIKYSRKNE